jgi:hypothetical protein
MIWVALGEWGKSLCYFLPDKNIPILIKSPWPFSSAGRSPLTAEPRWDYRSSRSFSPRTFALHYFRPKSRLVTNQLFYLPKFTEVLAVTMSGEKRPAPEGFGTSHQLVVKRNKAAENAGTELVKGSSQNGALIQSVCADFALEAQRALAEYSQLIRVYRFLAQVVWMLLSWSSRVRHCRQSVTIHALIEGTYKATLAKYLQFDSTLPLNILHPERWIVPSVCFIFIRERSRRL